MHRAVEREDVITLMRRENMTSSDERARPRWAIPFAAIARMVVPMKRTSTALVATHRTGNSSLLRVVAR